MNRADCIRELLAEYQNQRLQNEQDLDLRTVQAEHANPEIARLLAEKREMPFASVKRLFATDDPDKRREIAEQMKQRGIFINGEIRRHLKDAGLPEDHLELQYRCPICQDTGYVGDAPSRFCDCFETRLRVKLYEDGGMASLAEQRFETFDLNRFPEVDGQRAQMAAIRAACEDYADSFPETRHQNLILTGTGGLGKTFLLNCIYERVISRGTPAVRITAFRMFETMRRQHFANSPEEMSFDELVETPLLLIDDLGTEPMMRNITVEYLFTLLNERLAARRHTVIATNLSPVQLKETYGERVASRLLDRSRCATMMLKGKDLRLL